MDLETFCTTVYVWVDDWYKQQIAAYEPRRPGAKARMSNSEVLALGIIGQWQVGVPWRSERGMVRYMQAHGKGMFPTMLERSEFNARLRDLWGVLIKVQQMIYELMESPDELYEVMDSLPLPAYTANQARREKSHWLWESSVGIGGNRSRFFHGDHLLVAMTSSGVITGWLTATAYIHERWLVEGLLSTRAGVPQLRGPRPRTKDAYQDRALPPVGHLGPIQAAGSQTHRPYLADKALNGDRWYQHWLNLYDAQVITVPPKHTPHAWPKSRRRWLASHRQVIESVFATLSEIFGLQRLNAHSRWGQYTRIAAKLAAYNLALMLNRWLGRPARALASLIC